MAIKYGFFNSINGDRKYTAADIGDFLQGLIASGVYHDSSTSLQVLAAGGMTVEVQPGRAMLNFKKLENDGPYGLTLAAGGSVDRIDAIVAYMDLSERACGITVKQGIPAAAPVAPAMTRTDVRYEVMLASIYVTKLTNEITQSKITDTRADTSVCGWVHGIIDQVDTADLFVQWQTAYEEAYAELGDYLEAQKAAWEKFFADVTADNVLPAPSLDDAYKIPAVNKSGNGYELIANKTRNIRNLLDNSDFRNPVNQRGKTSYTGTNKKYTIDRWIANEQVDVKDGYISLVNNQTYEPLPSSKFGQVFEIGTFVPGKVYTGAALLADGTLCVGYDTAEDKAGIRLFKTADGILSMGIWANSSIYGGDYVYFDIDKETTDTVAVDIVWAALYEGEYTAETLPEYQPKGYAAELAECMRYFQKFGRAQVSASAVSSKSLLITPPCKTKMRAYPTLSAMAFVHLRGGGVNITEFPTCTAAAFGGDAGNPNYTLNFDSDLGVNQFYVSMLYMQGELSADL